VTDLWWKRGVIYQIYPRSFQDTNGDGIGDLQGIIDRLDYLNGTDRSLGIDAIWLSPTYPSPMADFGYDVSDYCDVHPDFGDLETMDRLIAAAHQRGIRIILDFVPNHTSSQHPWFLESRTSTDNPRRDWYVWRDAKPDGSPPNNWIGAFGGPAWEWDQRTQQYYLHEFLIEQPDLNWRNPEVEEAMHDVLRFWLERGVDGFRIDVMDRIVKDPLIRDNPPEPNRELARRFGQTALQRHVYDQNWPDIIEYTRRIRKTVDAYPERYTVGEVFGTAENIVRYYGGAACDGLHQGFNFPLVRMSERQWSAAWMRRQVETFERALPPCAWPNWVTGNHDVDRLITRLGGGVAGAARARVLAVLLLSLRGTPFIYYGEEIGMENVDVPPDRQQDPARIYGRGRDGERSPMQWTAEGDFSAAEPWLPDGDLRRNVQDQIEDRTSMLSLYRTLIAARRSSAALTMGTYAGLDATPDDVFAFTRTNGAARTVTIANFAEEQREVTLPDAHEPATFLAGTHGEREIAKTLRLDPLEAVVFSLA